jgi:hypothetical protein
VKLWLDDVRTPPDRSWAWVTTVPAAIILMESGEVTAASLDHDLGQDEDGQELPEGRTLVYWTAENDRWPSEAISVHSANVVGVEYVIGMIARYGPFKRVGQTRQFVRAEYGRESHG